MQPATSLKKRIRYSVFLWILRNFYELLFYRTPPDNSGPQVSNFIKRRFQTGCFPVNIAKFLRTLFFFYRTPPRRLLLLISILFYVFANREQAQYIVRVSCNTLKFNRKVTRTASLGFFVKRLLRTCNLRINNPAGKYIPKLNLV